MEKGSDAKPKLKTTHRYYSQVQAVMWVIGANHCYFIVWTEGHRPLYLRIDFDPVYCASMVNRITLFYKAYVLPCMLGYTDIFHCPQCGKVILEQAEINKPEENSVQCDNCSAWWSIVCAGVSEEIAEAVESWLCHSCLTNAIDDNSDRKDDSNAGSEDEMPSDNDNDNESESTLACDINICSVCSDSSIPVGGAHICSVCSKAIHAWCSIHEDTTNSAHLKCNNCNNNI